MSFIPLTNSPSVSVLAQDSDAAIAKYSPTGSKLAIISPGLQVHPTIGQMRPLYSTDGGLSWSTIDGLPSPGNERPEGSVSIGKRAIILHYVSPTSAFGAWSSPDLISWEKVLSERIDTKGLAADRANTGRWLARESNFTGSNIHKTVDGGENWIEQTISSGIIKPIVLGSRFFALGPSGVGGGRNTVYNNPDGFSWSAETLPDLGAGTITHVFGG